MTDIDPNDERSDGPDAVGDTGSNRSSQQSSSSQGSEFRRWRRHAPLFGQGTVAILGGLKGGKTTLFNRLAGRRQRQFRYPTTGLELSYATSNRGPFRVLLDFPGVNSLMDTSEDALVVRDLLLHQRLDKAVVVLDAKNLKRGLHLLLQLERFGVPLVVVLNMMDEARQRGISIDVSLLSEKLSVPVVATVAVEGQGVGELKRALANARPLRIAGSQPSELFEPLSRLLETESSGQPSCSGLAFCLAARLEGSPHALRTMFSEEAGLRALNVRDQLDSTCEESLGTQLVEADLLRAEQLADQVMERRAVARSGLGERLARWSRQPKTGIPIALVVLALVYLVVGWFGAEVLVDLLEGWLFGEILVPIVEGWVSHLPWLWLRELLVGPFGLVTVGIVLSFGIVVPVLGTFFLVLGALEDSAYLYRLSVLLDRGLNRIGLNGKGVLPLLMGLSCVTMALLTTRMLDTKKQRIIASLLLVFSFPCAPMLGVMMVLLGRMSIWATVVLVLILLGQFFFVGVMAQLLIPGKREPFILELPPLRMPRLGNVLVKAGHRLWWFIKEALPYFIIGTIILFALDQGGSLDWMRESMRPILVHWLGLPRESADVFLMTIIRREVGTALLLQQYTEGLYTGVQGLVALLVMTLLVPCINSILVLYKERGVLVSTAILAFVAVFSVLFGALMNWLLTLLEVTF